MAQSSKTLPGFRLALGFTLFYLGVIILVPIGGLVIKSLDLTWAEFRDLATAPRAMAAYRLSFGASLMAASLNAIFGTILAWTLVRYQFPGKRLLDALVDIPFAMPTAVAGLTLANLFSSRGWLGQFLVPMGFKVAYTDIGVVIALTFVSLPFVVRTVQPVLEHLDRDVEEAAATLGASRFRTFMTVVAPVLLPSVITGFALSFARSVGEFGSVIFISSNLPMKTEIVPLVIITYLEEYEFAAATTLAMVMLIASFTLLICINLIERWAGRYQA